MPKSKKRDENDKLQGSSKLPNSKDHEEKITAFLAMLNVQESIPMLNCRDVEDNALEESDESVDSQNDNNNDDDDDVDEDDDDDGSSNDSQEVAKSSSKGIISSLNGVSLTDIETFKRKLIRTDRFISKKEAEVLDKNKRTMKVAARSAVLDNSPMKTNSAIQSSNIKLNKNVRINACCDVDKSIKGKKKNELTAVKVIVIDRSELTVSSLVELIKRKYSITSGLYYKLYNDIRIVISGREFSSVISLNELKDDMAVQLYHNANPNEEEEEGEEEEEEGKEVIFRNDICKPIEIEVTVDSAVESQSPNVGRIGNAAKSMSMLNDYIQLINTDDYKKLCEERSLLPVCAAKEAFLGLLKSNQIIVLSGETGSGKTTQLPTYILDDMILQNRGDEAFIICTQPRRIAAITVAERVAYERCEKSLQGSDRLCGDMIGYQVRLQSQQSPNTRILHCTTGVLLRYFLVKANDIFYLFAAVGNFKTAIS